MKVIDLLQMPVEDMPEKIKVYGYTLYKTGESILTTLYETEDRHSWCSIDYFKLDDELEIIEEHKIEKLDEEDAYRDPNNIVHTWSEKEAILVRKINELIDEHERMIKEK